MSTFVLKGIALLLMVVDHLGGYFEGMPIWFRLLGRSSFPLFLFCMVWGYHYTRNRGKYLLRLYLMSVFMGVFMLSVNRLFPTEMGYGNHNIFMSMLWVGILISTIEACAQSPKKGALLLGGIFATQVLYYLLPMFLPVMRNLNGDITASFIPNLGLCEYGLEGVVLGVLMYFLKEKKNLFSTMYLLFCITQFSSEMLSNFTFTQCFMVLALPLMLRYNHQKGPGMKWFFYIFYPAHSFLLFYLANFVLG